MTTVGRFLFRYRGVIGLSAFILVYIFAKPQYDKILASLPFILIGLVLRAWAVGYIGKNARSKEINPALPQSQTAKSQLVSDNIRKGWVNAPALITAGPYRFIRHPLYLGNFFLTLGVLIALVSPFCLAITVMILFVIEYYFIIKSEGKFLTEKFGDEPRPSKLIGRKRREMFNYEEGRGEYLDYQKTGGFIFRSVPFLHSLPASLSHQRGEEEGKHDMGIETFSFRNALNEIRTIIILAIIYGLIILRAKYLC